MASLNPIIESHKQLLVFGDYTTSQFTVYSFDHTSGTFKDRERFILDRGRKVEVFKNNFIVHNGRAVKAIEYSPKEDTYKELGEYAPAVDFVLFETDSSVARGERSDPFPVMVIMNYAACIFARFDAEGGFNPLTNILTSRSGQKWMSINKLTEETFYLTNETTYEFYRISFHEKFELILTHRVPMDSTFAGSVLSLGRDRYGFTGSGRIFQLFPLATGAKEDEFSEYRHIHRFPGHIELVLAEDALLISSPMGVPNAKDQMSIWIEEKEGKWVQTEYKFSGKSAEGTADAITVQYSTPARVPVSVSMTHILRWNPKARTLKTLFEVPALKDVKILSSGVYALEDKGDVFFLSPTRKETQPKVWSASKKSTLKVLPPRPSEFKELSSLLAPAMSSLVKDLVDIIVRFV